jgi:hypothetical protein
MIFRRCGGGGTAGVWQSRAEPRLRGLGGAAVGESVFLAFKAWGRPAPDRAAR